MSENAEAPRPRRPRKVTAMISPELHARLHVAKLASGKTLGELMNEALELIVTHYRPSRKS
jgi:hypothetical protein